jgi:hypothetical protein
MSILTEVPFIELLNTMILMMAVMGGYMFVMSWRRDRRRELELNREELHYQTQAIKEQAQAADSSIDKGGYVKVNVPEEHQSLFHDFLKGFEEFAALSGYKVSFSADSSDGSSFGFKFTILESGISVSTEKVKADFNQYLKKIESGEPLDNLPVVTTPEEHDLLLTKLKNRINFLQHSYNLSTNTIGYYERLLKSTPSQMGFQQAPPVIVQTGGQLDSRSFNSSGAETLIQGDNSKLSSIKNDSSVTISNSFNQRKIQIEELATLIELIRAENDPSSNQATIELEKVKSEIEDEESPDPNRIEKWLRKAGKALDTAKKSKEVIDKAKEVYTSFNVPGLIESISSVVD